MAHVKAGGATRQTGNIAGKRLGVKVYGGQSAIIGNIIIRQKGTKFHPGNGVKMGRDFTIYAVADGQVNFRKMTGTKRGKFFVDVVPMTVKATSASESGKKGVSARAAKAKRATK